MLTEHRAATDVIAVLRATVGRNPYDKALSDLVGEIELNYQSFELPACCITCSALQTVTARSAWHFGWRTDSSRTTYVGSAFRWRTDTTPSFVFCDLPPTLADGCFRFSW